jgi:methylmalonyl-CoA/ethylmalonyl-CoA epimerase
MLNHKLSHIGVIVKELDPFGELLGHLFSIEAVSAKVEDPSQDAILRMYKSDSCYLELISPNSESSNLHTILKNKGESLTHLCYETSNVDASLSQVVDAGGLVIKPPTPAVLFGGKNVAFAMLPNRMIIEFVESGWLENMPQ